MKFGLSFTSLLVELLIVCSAFAGTIVDDFEDGELADFWDPFPEVYRDNPQMVPFTDADEHDGTLCAHTKASQFKQFWLRDPIKGDFEVSVEYHDYPTNIPSTHLLITIRDAGAALENSRRLSLDGASIQFDGKEAGDWVFHNPPVGQRSSPDGKLKVTRKGNTLTCVVWDGDNLMEFDKEVTFDYDPLIVGLMTQSWGAAELTNGDFDNFELTGPNVPNLSGAPVTLKDELPFCWGRIKTAVMQ